MNSDNDPLIQPGYNPFPATVVAVAILLCGAIAFGALLVHWLA